MERDCLRYFDVLDKTLTAVRSKVGCVQSQSETVRFGVKDLDVRQVIDFSHTLNLNELNKVTILVGVALVFVDVHSGIFSLLDAADNELLGCFSILVCDLELGYVV